MATLVTRTVSIIRPADTNAYAANDAWSDSTTAPTTGGFTIANAAAASGGSGIITGLNAYNSGAASLYGEVYVFRSAATAINDNAAWALSDTDAKLLVAIIPFITEAQPSNGVASYGNILKQFTCSGSADLRALVKVKSAYTPASAEDLTLEFDIWQP